MLTIRKAFLLVALGLVCVPLALFGVWPRPSPLLLPELLSIGVLVATLVALRLGLLIVLPIRDMIATVRRMEAGNSSARVAVSGALVPREIRTLQMAFNAMAAGQARAQEREREARLKAEQASTAKSDFLRFVTHELRSPTNAVIGFAEMLASERHGPLGAPSYREHVRDIVTGSRHLLGLINDLLDLSRIEAGQYHLYPEAVGLDELFELCIRYLRPTLTERGATLEWDRSRPPPTVLVDERAMFQVLLNLTANAVRYGRRGGRVVMAAGRLADGSVAVTVTDDGPGIAAADLDRIMEPFQRVASKEDGQSDAHMGTGLGLPIVKRLVELHGGAFTLASALGPGTTARIVLPAARVLPEPAVAVAA